MMVTFKAQKFFQFTPTRLIFSIILLTFFIQYGFADPYVVDENFSVEKYLSGLNYPSSLLFIDSDILVLEKNNGNIRLIHDGKLEPNPVLHVDVDNRKEGGLLGITKSGQSIYIYYTTSLDEKGENLVNQIWKYTWENNKLVNGKLVKQLSSGLKVHEHNGGAMATGLDGMVYAVTGDAEKRGLLQNFPDEKIFDSGMITKVNFDENVIEPSMSENPFDHYQGIGIRNSFGLAIDPITGNLWDTENGHDVFDEINLVYPQFNSGWKKIMGPSDKMDKIPQIGNFVYSDPKFSWESTIAPTALTFVNSESFENYRDFMFVGDFNTGSIYQFKLNSERDGFVFEDKDLQDLVLNNGDVINSIIFSSGYQGVTDLEFGPDGSLYILSILDGSIYKITPQTMTSENTSNGDSNWFKAIFLWLASIFEGNIDTTACDKPIEPRVDFSNCNLEGNNLSYSDLKLSKFIESNLKDINFKESDLRSVNFEDAKIIDSDFSKTDLTFANLRNVNAQKVTLEGARIYNANLENSHFTNSTLSLVNFGKSNLRNSDLRDSTLTNSKFLYSSLANADLSGSTGSNADFFIANLTNADLSNSNFVSSKFKFAKAENIKLNNANFSNSLFFGAVLNNANLSHSKFSNSDFSKAKLTGADLSSGNFEGANFSESNLTNSNLSNTKFQNANLEFTNLKGANLSYADLSKSNINGADFTDAITTGCIGCPVQ